MIPEVCEYLFLPPFLEKFPSCLVFFCSYQGAAALLLSSVWHNLRKDVPQHANDLRIDAAVRHENGDL